MRKSFKLTAIALFGVLIASGQARGSGWDPEKDRKELAAAESTLKEFHTAEFEPYFKEAYGYAVFPVVGNAALLFGGSYGTGKVYVNGALVGNARISKASIGFQAGGEAYSEIVFFRDRNAFERFKKGESSLHASASAAAATVGANAEAAWQGDVAVFTRSKGGLMVSAAVGGQRFDFDPLPE